MTANIQLHYNDLPDNVSFSGSVAVDTETMGLNLFRDRLCLVQLSDENGNCHLVKLNGNYDAPNLKKLFADPDLVKIFHYARFDIAAIRKYLDVVCAPVYCTKIASRLCRTNAPKHNLKALCDEFLDVSLDKEQQTSDWGAETLSEEQQRYAAGDVLYLHAIKDELEKRLEREGRTTLAQACFDFLPTRAALDLAGWPDFDIFAH